MAMAMFMGVDVGFLRILPITLAWMSASVTQQKVKRYCGIN
jgi:hypothetical protein